MNRLDTDRLVTRLSWPEDGIGAEEVITVRKRGWSPERHQVEHTKAFTARLKQRYMDLCQLRYQERVDYAETADWGPPKGWSEREGMREYKKRRYLEFEAGKHAESMAGLKAMRPYAPRDLRKPLPHVVYADRSEQVAAKYDGVTFERLPD